MQIHEITLAQLNEGIGQDIKSAVTAPFKKAGAILSTPGAMTNPGVAASAMDKYYQDDNARLQAQFDQKKSSRLAAQTQQRAAQLAQQWLQQVQAKKPTGPIKASPSAPTPLKPTGQYATNRNAGQVVNPTPAGILPEAQGYLPTPAEQAKLQQKVADAEASTNPPKGFAGQNWTQDKKTKKWSKISSDPAAGNAVNPAVTANPKTVMTGNRANEFKAWVDKQLTSQVTGTNQTVSMAQVRQDPAVSQQLAQLLPAIIMKNDPAAIEQYLTIAMTAMQKLSTQIRQTQKAANPNRATSVSPLSMLISPDTIEKIKTMSQDPLKAKAIKDALGLR
jgi:hypothetical protein